MVDRRLTAGDARRNDPDKRFSSLEAEIEMGGPTERAAAAAHFQTRADAAFRLYGLAAPPIFSCESLRDYRRRLLTGLAPYSDKLRGVQFSAIPREALPPFEKMAIDDAVNLFERPEGPLRSCVRRDHTGREATHWYGDERAAWEPFCNGEKRGRIDHKLCTGENGPEARAQRAHAANEQSRLMALGRAAEAASQQRASV